MRIHQAMILAAGLGKRLHPLTLTTPKPLLPLNGKPLISFVFEKLHLHGIRDVVVNIHSHAPQMRSYLATLSGIHITIFEEEELLETGGAVLKALPHFGESPFFVLNADTWWQEGESPLLSSLNAQWDGERMDALLAVSKKYHGIGFDGKGDYHLEKGKLCSHTPNPSYSFIGARILHPRLFFNNPLGAFGQKILFDRAEQVQKLYGEIHPHPWCDVGTFQRYEALQAFIK